MQRQRGQKTTTQSALIGRTPTLTTPALARDRRPLQPQRIDVRHRHRRPSVPVSFWREPDYVDGLVWNIGDVLEISDTTMVLSTPWYATRATRVQMRMLVGRDFFAFDARVTRSLELLNGRSRIHLEFDAPQRDLCATLRGLSRRRAGQAA